MPGAREARTGRGIGRRQLLLGGAAAGLGAAAAIGADLAFGGEFGAARAAAPEPARHGGDVVPFHGEHQAGVGVVPQAHSAFLALDLLETTDRERLRRLMRILTDDAVRLTAGRGALADSEPELAVAPARLTVTFGFGTGLVARAGGRAPAWLAPLPDFAIDRLEDRWSHGDLLIEVAADDPLTVAHAARMVLKDARSFARPRWRQDGFRNARGSHPTGTTMRNLFGQVDGTANPQPGTADFDEVVYAKDGWLAGGSGLVVRRIHMTLDTWDGLDRAGRDLAAGRRMSDGAPLTGDREHDEPDFAAVGPTGFPIIPAFAHIRRARGVDESGRVTGGERIYRRAYNYDVPPSGAEVSDSGLIFAAYQADIARQFTPMQERLAHFDLLNEWTIPIGSAVFAVPPGCEPGGYIGETLLD